MALEVALVAIIVVVYATPFLAGWRAMNFAPIPPRLAPDIYLHLVLGDLPRVERGVVLNPWYQIPVAEAELVYLRFGGALRVFHLLRSVLATGLASTVLVWTVLWTVLISLAARWVVSLLLEKPPFALVALSLGLIMFLDAGYVQRMLSVSLVTGPLGNPSFPTLPYHRPFFPQVAVPLLLLYVGLQIRVLVKPRRRYWVAMGAIQLLSLSVFPFATLLMAALTGFTLTFAAAGGGVAIRWPHVAGFVVLCGAADVLFIAVNSPALRLLAGHTPLLRPDPVRLRLIFGYSVLLVAFLALIVTVVIRRRPPVRSTLLGLGVGTALLLLSDGLLSTALQTTHHVGYLVHTTIALLTVGLCAEVHPMLTRWSRRAAQGGAVALAVVMLVYGGLASYLTLRWYLPRNVARADLAAALSAAAPNDLIVAPDDALEEETSWLPLVSKAQVLFSRSAEFALGAADAAADARRLAFFLFLQGETAESIRAELGVRGFSLGQRFLAGFRRMQLLSSGERDRVLEAVGRELIPPLLDAERRAPEVVRFFRQYRRIFVVDRVDDPFFRADHVNVFIRLEGERRLAEPWILRWGTPA